MTSFAGRRVSRHRKGPAATSRPRPGSLPTLQSHSLVRVVLLSERWHIGEDQLMRSTQRRCFMSVGIRRLFSRSFIVSCALLVATSAFADKGFNEHGDILIADQFNNSRP